MLTALKGQIDSNTKIMREFNTPITTMEISSRQKTNMETQALNYILDQIELIDIYRTVHPKAAEYTFFSSAQGIFSRVDHIMDHKSSVGKYKKIEIT